MNPYEILNDEHKRQAEEARKHADEQRRQQEAEAQKRAAAEQLEREQKGYKVLDETAERLTAEQHKAQAVAEARDQFLGNSYDVTHGPSGSGSQAHAPMEVIGPDIQQLQQGNAARQINRERRDVQYTPMGTVFSQSQSRGATQAHERREDTSSTAGNGSGTTSDTTPGYRSIGHEISDRAQKARDLATWLKDRSAKKLGKEHELDGGHEM